MSDPHPADPSGTDPGIDADSPPAASPAPTTRHEVVPFGRAVRIWFTISLQTFGGPAGQIAVMQRTLVDDKRWIGQHRFLHALNYCMLLPGPEAQQLAIYLGWLLGGLRGGLVAGILFVLPGMVALLALSAIYVGFGDTTVVTALFAGLAPAVLAVVAHAVLQVGRRVLRRPALLVLAGAAFLALALFGVPFPVVLAAAAVTGWVLGRRSRHLVDPAAPEEPDGRSAPLVAESAPLVADHTLPPPQRSSASRMARILGVGIVLWALPVLAVALLTGPDSVYTTQGLFFSGSALITFGGAYAVLAFVAQQAVQTFGWLTAGDMVHGLALAESTPGPLIMVVQFVAFLGAYADPGPLNPWVAGVVGALLTTWVTFVPCFLFIFLGAPHVERLRHSRALSNALTGITAAVVGVIANLALYFACTTLYTKTRLVDAGPLTVRLPELTTLRPVSLAIAVIAAVLVFGARWSVLRTLGVCAVLGLTAGLLGLPVA